MVGLERSSRSPPSVLSRRRKKPKIKQNNKADAKNKDPVLLYGDSSIEFQGTNKHYISFRGQQVKNNNSVNIQFAVEAACFPRPSPVMIWVFHLVACCISHYLVNRGSSALHVRLPPSNEPHYGQAEGVLHMGSTWRCFIYRLHSPTSHFPADAVISCDLTWSDLTSPFSVFADRLAPAATLTSTFLSFVLPARTKRRPDICRLSATWKKPLQGSTGCFFDFFFFF